MSPIAYLLLGVLTLLLVCAALIDARTRTYPNALAGAVALTSAALALALDGPARLVRGAACALGVLVLLIGLELLWRRRGSRGIGMGDLKCLGALMLATPFAALVSFAAGLLLMALAALARRKHALPLLPFFVPCYLITLCALGVRAV